MILEVVINSTAIMQIRGVRMQDVGRPLLGTLKLKSRDETASWSAAAWTGQVSFRRHQGAFPGGERTRQLSGSCPGTTAWHGWRPGPLPTHRPRDAVHGRSCAWVSSTRQIRMYLCFFVHDCLESSLAPLVQPRILLA